MPSLGILLGAAILRIVVDAPGVYRVPPEAVKDAGLDLARCGLFGGATGTALPIAVEGGGFTFAAPVRTRHSRRTSFVLRPLRAGEAPGAAETFARAPEGYFRCEKNDAYDALDTEMRDALEPYGYGGADYFYFGPPAAKQEWKIEIPRGSAPGEQVRVTIAMQGERAAGASNGADVAWNGAPVLKAERWAGSKGHVAEFLVDAGSVKAENVLRIDARDGRIRLDWVEAGLLAPDPAAAKSPRKPHGLEKASPEDLHAGGADWLAVAVDGALDAVRPLATHRAAQGLRTRVVKLSDVFDEFSAGNFDPRAIRRLLEHAAKAWKPAPRYVLLVGDATYDVDWLRGPGEVLPAALVDTFDNGASATDNWFAAYGDDPAQPMVAIGRFPVSQPAAVKALVEKTIAYETKSPFGPWRRKLTFFAGEGRFGEAVDRAIEELATTIFNEYVPQSYELNMTYASLASPYCWVPQKLTEKIVERMNEGAAIVNYTGHGARDSLDDLHYKGKRYPTFASGDVPKVKCADRRPIVFITACWTGCFDYPRETSVGEKLFLHDAGPAAVFASSRVSHPYANAILSKELVAALFLKGAPEPATSTSTSTSTTGERNEPPRLGDVVVSAKRLMRDAKDQYRDTIAGFGLMFLGDPMLLVRLLNDDVQLYNLFGDPALRLPFPKGTIALEPVGEAIPGRKLVVRGRTDALEDGRAIVTFEIERKRIRGDLAPVELEKPGAEKRIAKNYETANDKVVARAEVKLEGGAFEASLALPEDLDFVKHFVKAYAWSAGGDAAGSADVQVTDGAQ